MVKRKILQLSVLLFFLINLSLLAQWEFVEQTAAVDTLNGVFTISSTAWAVGDNGTIIISTNAGENWTALTSGTSSNLNDVYFHNANVGITVGREGIFRTLDGGQSWSHVEGENSSYLQAVSFANENVGAAVSISGSVYVTEDGGATWTLSSSVQFGGAYSTDIDVVNDSIAFVVESSGDVFKTIDGCDSWFKTKAAPVGSSFGDFLQGVSFYDENNGAVVGANSSLTSDGGQNWNQLVSYLGGPQDVQFVNSQLCYTAGYSGSIYRSTDGGNTWSEQESGTSSTLNSVFFVDENNGIAVGDDGTIVRTTNGGVTSVNPSETIPVKYNLSQNYPNPFNPSTTISYSIPKQSHVSLKVFDVLGKEVAELINTEKPAGNYEINFDASQLSSGIYFYSLATHNKLLTKKMLLVK